MSKKRRNFSAQFKLETVLDGLRGEKTVAQICRERDITESLYYKWRDAFFERATDIFADQRGPQRDEQAERIAELERLAGKQALEIEILKHILKLVTYNADVIEAQSLDRVSMSWRPRILKWEHRIPQL